MHNISSFLKRFNFLRVLTVFLAGVMLFFSTACGSSSVEAKALDGNPRPEIPSEVLGNTYEGGMNDFRDVDPRRDTSAADRKAEALVDNAEHNIQKRADSSEQYTRNYRSGTPLGERVENLTEDVTESTKNTAKGVAKGTERGLDNLKDNTRNATKNVAKGTREAGDNVKDKASDAGNTLSDKAHDAADNITGLFTDKNK